ncbi:MAG: hypothetical protein GXO66_02265 [Euryarchaeota archaeon]|nr:hypothetical protein [Euryarchaeota archaeon]
MSSLALVMTAVGVFLMLDAVLAFLFGSRYIALGITRAPRFYRRFIQRLLELPRVQLLALELAEFSLGLVLFLLAGRL